MKTRTLTIMSETLLIEALDEDERKIFEITVFHSEPENSTPFRVALGCQETFLFESDVRKIIKMLNAALRIRRESK